MNHLAPTSFIGCLAYGRDLMPEDCLDNQLSDYCMPWFPCWECERPVTIELPERVENYDRNYDKPRRTWPKGMSKSVARNLGLV